MHVIRIRWTFYKSFILFPLLISFCCAGLFLEYGFSIFVALFWLKIATLAISFYFINYYKRHEYYYYFNLGISKRQLWMPLMVLDLLLFVSAILIIHHFK